jgi:imidazolonepropionase-like amidohydrolase
MKQLIYILLIVSFVQARAQENIYPAPKQGKAIILENGTVHVGNGQVKERCNVLIVDGKIKLISSDAIDADAERINCTGQHIYPGLIVSTTAMGLIEVGAVRATHDDNELGNLNPSVRSIVAYNTDSKVINTVRSNGILLANVVPQGDLLCGSSSVVQLDAWNWEDAAYKTDIGMHLRMPGLLYRKPWWLDDAKDNDADYVKNNLAKLDSIKQFFAEAKAYCAAQKSTPINLKFEACRKLFNGTQKLFVHAYSAKEMLMAINMANDIGCKLVIVGANEAPSLLDQLKKNNVEIILSNPHSLPNTSDDEIDQAYARASQLQKAGITYTITMEEDDAFWQIRNLPFTAGTMATYGLSKEEALQAITLNAAKILDIADRTGTIEVGKDANIIVSKGDVLDMRSSILSYAFIQGRNINLNNKQTQLFEKYKYKYGIKN